MPELPTKVNPAIPTAFDYIVSKALAKKPEDRYQSAREMADDLRNFRNLTITAPLPSPALPGERPVANSQKNGDATIFLEPIRKTPVIPGWSLQKKRISMGIAVIFLATAILFIYVSVPTIDLQPPSATKSKVAGAQSKARKNKEAVNARADIDFTVLPWGEVFLDGKSLGVSPPLKKIKLTPGQHRIEIRNATFSPYRKTIKVEAGESLKIRHKFN
jgi:serine/threonine-protein kinase